MTLRILRNLVRWFYMVLCCIVHILEYRNARMHRARTHARTQYRTITRKLKVAENGIALSSVFLFFLPGHLDRPRKMLEKRHISREKLALIQSIFWYFVALRRNPKNLMTWWYLALYQMQSEYTSVCTCVHLEICTQRGSTCELCSQL